MRSTALASQVGTFDISTRRAGLQHGFGIQTEGWRGSSGSLKLLAGFDRAGIGRMPTRMIGGEFVKRTMCARYARCSRPGH